MALVAGCTSAQKKLPESTGSMSDIDTLETAVEFPESSQLSPEASYQAVAKSKYGDRVEFFFNNSRSYVICVAGKDRFKSPFPKISSQLRFFVYDLTSDRILFEESLDNASVSWKKDTLLKVSVTPGIVQTGKSLEYGYLYDIVARQKLPLQ